MEVLGQEIITPNLPVLPGPFVEHLTFGDVAQSKLKLVRTPLNNLLRGF